MLQSPVNATRAGRLFYGVTFLDSLTFTLPVWLLFGHDYLGLSYVSIILLISVPHYLLGGLLQVPCGAWADRNGRRKAYLIGTVLWASAAVPFLVTKDLWLFVFTIPLISFGSALRAGSLEAIMSEIADQTARGYHHITSNATTIFYLSRVVASAIGGLLYAIDPRWPTAAVGIAACCSFVLASFFPEVHIRHESHGRTLLSTTRAGLQVVRSERNAIAALIAFMGFIFVAEIVWLGYQPRFVEVGISAAALGFIYAGFSLLSAVGGQLARVLIPRVATGLLQKILVGVCGVAATGMAVISGPSVAFLPVGPQLANGMSFPLINTYLVSRSPKELRATVLSVVEFVQGPVIILAWIVGALLLDHAGIPWLFVVATTVSAATIAFAVVRPVRERADQPGIV